MMEKSPGASPLPPKELSLFKRIVKYYDQKQYKTGLKFANTILSNPKYSEHGETLSMKGILLNCMGKKEEARDLVKRGLRSNIKSFVCWHIYGLIMKSDQKYEEAIRCYIQALKLDTNNLQVLRDLSTLQMHTRDLEGCRVTRNQLLTQRPSQKASWVGYAIIQHLMGDYEAAANIINEFQKVQTAVEPYNYEHSELLLYYVSILIESERFADAISFMESHTKEIVDKAVYLEIHADISLRLERIQDAEMDSWKLLERNPENKNYYDLLYRVQKALTNSELKKSTKKGLLEKCMKQFPMARLPRLLFLDQLEGDEFAQHVDAFLRKNLQKGVPTLFIQVKRFYDSTEKRKILEDLYLTYRKNLDDRKTLGPVSYGKLKSEANDEIVEPPSTSLWLNYLLGYHFNFMQQTQRALDIVSDELEKNPTIVDLYVLKAEIYRDAGDVVTASRWMEEAQSLDTADRFINAQCTKYMVQAQRFEDAETMAAKFTRGSSTASAYLSEMQCMWFLNENARSAWNMNKYGEALKLCHEIDKHFSAILEDQLDFNSYCLRKGTLRSYIETIRLEDRLRDHPAYFDAASLAIEIYLYLHMNPLGDDSEENDESNANLSSADLKKLKNKQRRAELRAKADAQRSKVDQERRDAAKRSGQGAGEKDEDTTNKAPEPEQLDPKKLCRPENVLNEAARFLQPLVDLSGNRIQTHCLAYEVYERKEKYMLMLRSIRRGLALPGAQDHPWFNSCIVRFLNNMEKLEKIDTSAKVTDDYQKLVHDTLLAEVRSVFSVPTRNPLPSAVKYNEDFLKRNSKSFIHVFNGILTKTILDPESTDACLSQLPLPSAKNLNGITWNSLLEALQLLKRYAALKQSQVSAQFIEDFRLACSESFQLAAVFFTPSAWEKHRSAAVEAATASTVNGACPKMTQAVLPATLAGDLATDDLTTKFSATSIDETAKPMVNGNNGPMAKAGGKNRKTKGGVHI